MARPTKYKPEFAEQVYKICLLGADDKRIASFFDVDEATINRWKKSQSQFCESLKRGKDAADAEVAHSLYLRALGYQHPEVDLKMYEGQIIKTDIIKHYPPDTTAGIFWLKNRQKTKWRDQHNIEATGEIGVTVKLTSYADDPDTK